MEFKGTQGDWLVVESKDVHAAVVSPGIATVCMDIENPQDARLIAAAPDLLSVLMEIVATDDAAIAELKSLMGQHMESSDLTVKARAAIAKALGE